MPSSLYKETLSDFLQVPVKFPTGRTPFGMLPQDVLRRTDLSAACKIVLAGLGQESRQTGRVAISHQALAFVCGLSRVTVFDCLQRLSAVGLIQEDGPRVKQVQPYRLMHPRMASSTAREGKHDPICARVVCPKCKKSRPALLKIGICRSCNWDLKIRRIVREETAVQMERIA